VLLFTSVVDKSPVVAKPVTVESIARAVEA